MNGIFNSFNSFNNKFLPGNRLINLFSSHFSFHLSDKKSVETRKTYFCKLNEIVFNASDDSKAAIIISDASIRNDVTISITHIHVYNFPIIKTIHHTINVTFTKAELLLFTIRCGLNQASYLANIKCIVIITDSIHVVKKIFNSFIHLY